MFGFGGKRVRRKNGKDVILLNPSEKAGKFAAELSTGIRYTNEGDYKVDENGEVGLSDTQRAYRSGYLDARQDSADAYNYNKAKKKGRLDEYKAERKRRNRKRNSRRGGKR